MRDILVMSIDPIGCEDVDDALSVRRLDNGNLEVCICSERRAAACEPVMML